MASRLRAVLGVAAAGLTLLASPRASAQVLVAPGESNETAFRREIRGHWFAWLAAQEEGDAALAGQKTEEIVKYAQKLGVRRLTDLAISATLLGRRELTAGKAGLAKESFDSAVKLDPDLPEARWGQVALASATNSWGDMPGAIWSALRTTFVDIESRRVAWARLLLILVLALALAGATLVVVLTVFYYRLFWHDLSEIAGKFTEGSVRKLLTAGLFVLPLLLSLDVVWLLLFLFVGVLAYATPAQKAAGVVALLVLVPVLPTLDYVAYDYVAGASPILRGAESLEESRYDQRVLDSLEAAKSALPDDADVRFLLGRLYQQLGQNDRAVAEYSAGAQLDKSENRCLNNRGNIHFVDGDFGSAQEDYQEALKRDSRNVAARYNLALVYAETFRTVEAAETLQAARALNARQVRRFQESPTLVKVVSQDYTIEDARRKMKSLETDPRTRRLLGHFRSYDPLTAPKTPIVLGILGAVAAALLLDRAREKKLGYSAECQKCRRTYCRLCKPAGESGQLCSQCIHVYLKKDGVAIETKLQKVEEARRRRVWEDRLRASGNIVLPGVSAFLESRVAVAFGTLALFFAGLVGAVGREGLGVVPRPVLASATAWTVAWVLIGFGGWLAGQLTAHQED